MATDTIYCMSCPTRACSYVCCDGACPCSGRMGEQELERADQCLRYEVILHAQLLHAGSPSLACTSMWLFLQLLIPC